MAESGIESGARRRVRLLPAVARRVWHALTNASPEERAEAQRQWEAGASSTRSAADAPRMRITPPSRSAGVDRGVDNGRSINPPQI